MLLTADGYALRILQKGPLKADGAACGAWTVGGSSAAAGGASAIRGSAGTHAWWRTGTVPFSFRRCLLQGVCGGWKRRAREEFQNRT
jgi:hypothetical protein